MRVLVAVGARLLRHAQIEARPRRRVAAEHGTALCLPTSAKLVERVQVDAEERRPEAGRRVARLALAAVVAVANSLVVLVRVAVGAATEASLR